MRWSELFSPRPVTDQDRLTRVRASFAALGETLEQDLPEGRYKAIVKTDLEKTAAMATKAFTHEEPARAPASGGKV